MTTYTVTTANWNDPAFWSGISETVSGHMLDFSGLPSSYSIDYDPYLNRVIIDDGTTTYTVGDAGYGGSPDATLGGSTLFDYFTTVFGTEGADSIYGSSTDDWLVGGGGDDTLEGDLGDDSIDGGDGDDLIRGQWGNDTIDGGSGSDTIEASDGSGTDVAYGGESAGDQDVLDLVGSTGASVSFTGDEAGTYTMGAASVTFSQFEELRGSDGNDTIDASATTSGMVLGGEAGADSITGGSGDDLISGGTGADTLLGGDGDDTLIGGSGNDSLDGGADADTFVLENGFGNDTIIGGETVTTGTDTDTLDLSAVTVPVTVLFTGDGAGTITDGTDTVTFSEIERIILGDSADSINASADGTGLEVITAGGNDDLTGGQGNDTFTGGDGADTLTGQNGADSLTGGAGNDLLGGDDGDDTLIGGDGDDEIYTGHGNNSVDAGTGNDSVYGDLGSDTVEGGDGADEIYGWTGADSLSGGAGDDTILGEAGDDTLTGGDGNDDFVYTAGDGNDTITDFNTGNTGTLSDADNTNNDFIDLSAFYDDIWELHADQADDGILNQSNDGVGGVDYTDNTSFGTGSLTFTGAAANGSFYTVENTNVVCFTSDTAITTPRGQVRIDDLKVGDLVTTMDDGPQRVVWIGRRTLGPAELAGNPKLRPILFKKGVLGLERKLLVSPQHGMVIGRGDTHLARARNLARHMPGVRVANGIRSVTYVHLLFERHQIVFAEGAPSESFYPGPWALRLADRSQRVELLSLFPELADVAAARATAESRYGKPCRSFVPNGVLKQAKVRSRRNGLPVDCNRLRDTGSAGIAMGLR